MSKKMANPIEASCENPNEAEPQQEEVVFTIPDNNPIYLAAQETREALRV
jgi:hypothetical protein